MIHSSHQVSVEVQTAEHYAPLPALPAGVSQPTVSFEYTDGDLITTFELADGNTVRCWTRGEDTFDDVDDSGELAALPHFGALRTWMHEVHERVDSYAYGVLVGALTPQVRAAVIESALTTNPGGELMGEPSLLSETSETSLLSEMREVRVRLDWMNEGDFVTAITNGTTWNGWPVLMLDTIAIDALDKAHAAIHGEGIFDYDEHPLELEEDPEHGVTLYDVQPDGVRTEMWHADDETGRRWFDFSGWTFDIVPDATQTPQD